jgi:hypothetical protein
MAFITCFKCAPRNVAPGLLESLKRNGYSASTSSSTISPTISETGCFSVGAGIREWYPSGLVGEERSYRGPVVLVG